MKVANRFWGSLLSLSAMLAGCGGGGSQYDAGTQQAPNASVSGSVMKGLLSHAHVIAYTVKDGKIDTSKNYDTYTDASGYYQLSLPATSDQVLIKVVPAADNSTVMTCDAPAGCGHYSTYPARAAAELDVVEPWGNIDFGDRFTVPANSTFLLSSVSPQLKMGTTTEVHVTPVTHLVAAWVQQMGISPSTLLVAESQATNLFNLPDGALALAPLDITASQSIASAGNAQIHYSVINSSIMEFAQGNSDADVPANLASVMQQLSDDFVNYNGQLIAREQDVAPNARSKNKNKVTLLDIAQAAATVTQYLSDNKSMGDDKYHSVLINVNQLIQNANSMDAGSVTHAIAESSVAVNSDTLFANQVWPVIQKQCVQCHVSGGIASGTSLIFDSNKALSDNLNVVKTYVALAQAKQGQSGLTLWLAKPTGDFAHVGGQVFSKTSSEYAAFKALADSFNPAVVIVSPNQNGSSTTNSNSTGNSGSSTASAQQPTSTGNTSTSSTPASNTTSTADPIFTFYKQSIAPVLAANSCQVCHRSGGVGGGYNLVAASVANADQTNYMAVSNYLKTSAHPAYFHEKPADGGVLHAGTKAFVVGDTTSLAFANFIKMVVPNVTIASLANTQNNTQQTGGTSSIGSGSTASTSSSPTNSGSSSSSTSNSGTSSSNGSSSTSTSGSTSSGSTSTSTSASSNFAYYTQNIEPVLNSANCQSCHRAKGVGGYELIVVKTAADSLTNFNEIVRYIQTPGKRTQLHDRAAIGGVSHAGSKPFTVGDATSQKFMQFINLIQPVVADSSDPLANLRFLSGKELLRKITLNLSSRLPTQAEYDAVANNGDVLPDALIDAIMTEDAFYDRLMEWWNDVLLTNSGYIAGGNPTIVSSQFLNGPYAFGYTDDKSPYPKSRNMTSTPLQLVKYLVKRDQDFRGIVTAPYMMVNKQTLADFGANASLYGGDQPPATDADWVRAQINTTAGMATGHAGLLTDFQFLRRYPSTSTNRHRARARAVYQLFLDTDLLALGQQGAAIPAGVKYPSRTEASCVGCHRVMDPVAQNFYQWSDNGWKDVNGQNDYNAGKIYSNTEMLSAGFIAEGGKINDGVSGLPNTPGTNDDLKLLPANQTATPLQWLGQQIANDPRFVRSIVKNAFRGVTGQLPIPESARDNGGSDLAAYNAEQRLFDEAGQIFVANGYKYKSLVKFFLTSPIFKAAAMQNADQAQTLQSFGFNRILSPERLSRKLRSVTGIDWTDLMNRYYFLYGGIDSRLLTVRLTAASGITEGIMERMANEVSCKAIQNQGMLLQSIDFTQVSDAYVKQQLKRLHQDLLGEFIDLTDPVLDTELALFKSVKDSSTANTSTACGNLKDTNGTHKAWMAVLAYFLMDFKFLYE